MQNSHTPKSIAIVGTGSLACLFAARLAKLANIQLVGSWQEQIDAINTRGITVHELDGTTSTTAVQAHRYPQQTMSIKPDYVIVLVKGYQTSAAIERIQNHITPETKVLTLQNGLGNLEQLKKGLPGHFISAGVTTQGGNIKSPGTVVHAGSGATIIDDAPQLTALLHLFNDVNIPTETAQQSGANTILEILWRKLIVNSGLNPLTALLGQPNGYLADNTSARALSEATAIETARIAKLEGAWPSQTFEDAATLITNAASVTGPNRSSMLQDISRGNRTEITSICGEVVLRAKKHGHAAPYNETWLTLVQQAECNTAGSGGLPLFTLEALVKAAEKSQL